MRVEMKTQISGTRNGKDWPAPGGVVDLPEDEAEGLVANGMAVLVEEGKEERAVLPQDDVEVRKGPGRPRKNNGGLTTQNGPGSS